MALTVPTGLVAPVAVADSGGGLGRPALPKQRVDRVHPVTGLGAGKARSHVARVKAANAAQAARARAEQRASWPAAGTATARIPAHGTARLTAGGLPVAVAPGGGKAKAVGEVQVRVLDQKQAHRVGVNGVLLAVTAADPGRAKLSVDYSAFASGYGGGWSGRLRLVQLPACALTTPQASACRVQTPLDSHNDIGDQLVTADLNLASLATSDAERTTRSEKGVAPAPGVGASSGTVLALTAGSGESASGAGNYTASPLSSSSTWAAGGSSGSFTWSYPMSTPPAAAGPAPGVTLSYDSGGVDGKTASTNNQGTQVGEGFQLSSSSYIERSYGSCDDDGQAGKYDLCWKYDNASLVLNGKSTELVKDDTTGVWHLKDDDASTVTRSLGANNGDGNGEYWTVTTGDGTQYVFGLNKLPGAGASDATNSVWTVPVFGDDSGEPGWGNGTTFSGRSVTQAWRWNLDYVVDLHGNAMSYWYVKETNYYGKDGATTGTAQYTRGGYLDRILYGQRSDALFTATASDKVTFSYTERCLAADCSSLTSSTAPNWPDVPFDLICASGAACSATGPSFFTRKRLTGVDSFAWSAAASPAAYTPVDSWVLAHQFLDPGDIGDSSDQSLVLSSVRRTGKTGTAISLDPVTFTYQMRVNRVDSSTDNILPLSRPRIGSVTSETGAITTVTLSNEECVRGSDMPTSEDNDTKNCYPVYWHINGAAEASLDWFHKYRVLAVVTSDPTGLGETMESAYSYSGPAWHYNDDPLTPSNERTWSIWRGYRSVTATTGVSGGTQSKTVSLYFQGMDGDKQKDGTTRSVQMAGVGFTGLSVADWTDSDQYAGVLREEITYNGSTPVSVTVNDLWSSNTASQQKSYANIKAYYVRTGEARTSTYLTATAGWRTRSVATTYDSYGMVSKVNNFGQLGLNGDETCTRTWYARNTSLGITSLVSRTRATRLTCSVADTGLSLPADTATRGDVLSDTATVYDNTTATAWSASQTPTLGEATWTGRASAYPATATNGERNPTSWQTVATTTYDTATAKLGRVLSVTDAAGNTTTTAYTPPDTGPVTRVQVTNAKAQNTFTYLDYARGTTVKSYDVNNKITESTYDALGRATAVWLPNRSRSAGYGANYTFAYSVGNSAPSWTSTSSILGDGVYNTSYAIYDSLLRPLQTQVPTPVGGRLLTDTRYDSRGLAYETYADVFDSTATPSGTYARAEYGRAPKQTGTVFDGAGRPTTSTFYAYGVQKWSTTTSYTGDSTATTAPAGGSATRVITDIFGRTTQRRDYASTSPADANYGGTAPLPAYTTTGFTYTRDSKQNTITGPDSAQWSYSYDLFGRQTSATDPDKGTTSTAYTALDQIDSTTDSRGSKLLYGYDVLGRKTDQWKTSKIDANKLAHRAYDTLLKGQLDSATRYVGGVSGTAYVQKVTAYDSMSRATATELDLPATDPMVTSGAVTSALTFSTYYNLNGTQQYVANPAAGGLSSEYVYTTHNALGLPTTVDGTSAYLLGASYSAIGQPEQFTLGTSAAAGIKKAYITNLYEEGTDRLTQSTVTDQTHGYELQELNYGYDAAGNVTHIFDPTVLGGTGAADNQCFDYDGHRRLTEAWTPATADCAAGGRTTGNLGGASPYWTSYTYTSGGLRSTETSHTAGGSTLNTYCYNATRPHALATVLTAGATCTGAPDTYTYDNTGNTTTRPDGTDTQTLTWTPEGQLDTLTEKTSAGVTKSTTSHVYDADGNLLIRRDPSGQSVLYLGATEVHLDTSTGTPAYWAQRYYTAGGATIAVRSNQSGTSTVTWLAADHHGTSSLAVDATTQAVTKRYTTPFGAPRTGGTGTWPDDKAFLGKTTDTSSGLTYIGARQYDPAIGRFTSVDPLLDTGDAQSINGYAYADNNPATFSDPTGREIGSKPNSCQYDLKYCTDAQKGSSQKSTSSGRSDTSGTASTPARPCVGDCKKMMDAYKCGILGCEAQHNFGRWCQHNEVTCAMLAKGPEFNRVAGQVLHLETELLGIAGFSDCKNGDFEACGELAQNGAFAAKMKLYGRALDEISELSGGLFQRCSFTLTTPVLMEGGKSKAIGDIQPGDKVAAADPETGKHDGPRTVTATHINHDDDLVDLTVETRPGHTSTIHTTSKHPFWDDTLHQWVLAAKLVPGHVLTTVTDHHVPVTAVRILRGSADMYNLTVDDLHTYYVLAGATPVLVHNSNCFGDKWSDANNLDEHFRKHGEEMGFDTMTEYNYAAQDLMCMCDGRRPGVLMKRDGDVQRFFDPESGEFGSAGPRGIITYFKPDDGLDYFRRQPGVEVP